MFTPLHVCSGKESIDNRAAVKALLCTQLVGMSAAAGHTSVSLCVLCSSQTVAAGLVFPRRLSLAAQVLLLVSGELVKLQWASGQEALAGP